MVSDAKVASPCVKTSLGELPIIFEPVFLEPEEDDARIKKLSKQILACVERAKQERRKRKIEKDSDNFFAKDLDEILGLNTFSSL